MTDETKETGTEVATKNQSATQVFRIQIDKMDTEFAAALPDHIPLARFKRVVQTAVNQNPDLLDADRRTLFQACTMAAQDGLLPDGRKAALVIFNTKIKGKNGERDRWVKAVQYMPMIAGVLEKVRNSAQLSGISANVVYAGDDFEFELGDNERIYHRPNLENRGAPFAVYAIAHLKDGMIEREVMTVLEIEDVRAISKAKDSGPWTKWWGEMARKTVMRRLSKRLPMSSDLDMMMRRDDSLYNLNEPADTPPALPRPVRTDYAKQISQHPDAIEAKPEGMGESEDPTPKPEPTKKAAGPYELTNYDGVVSEYKQPGHFTDAFLAAIKEAPDTGSLESLQLDHSDALDRLKKDGDQGPGWHAELMEAAKARFLELSAPADDKGGRQGEMV